MLDQLITSIFYDDLSCTRGVTKTVKFARCVYRPGTFNTPRDRDPRDLSFSFPSRLHRFATGSQRLTSATTPRKAMVRRSRPVVGRSNRMMHA